MGYSSLRGSAYEQGQLGLPREIFSAMSIGFGTYVFVSLAIYMAVLSIKQFMAARAAGANAIANSQELSA